MCKQVLNVDTSPCDKQKHVKQRYEINTEKRLIEMFVMLYVFCFFSIIYGNIKGINSVCLFMNILMHCWLCSFHTDLSTCIKLICYIASILILQIPETKLFCPLLQCLHENTCVYLFISFDIYMRISKKNMFFFQILFIIFIHIVFCDTATCVYLENIHIYWLCLIHMQRKYGMTNHTKSMGMPLKHFRL